MDSCSYIYYEGAFTVYFLVSFKQIIVMFILMGVGFFCSQAKILYPQTNQELTKILLYIVSPCIIISAFFRLVTAFLLALVSNTLVFTLSILLAHLLFKRTGFSERNTFKFIATYSNGGFMGIPLVQAMMGTTGTFFAVPYLVIYNIFLWSHGVSIFKKQHHNWREQVQTILRNPNIIATVIGILIFSTHLTILSIVQEPIKDIVGVNTPLSMIVIGANLGTISKDALKQKSVWFAVIVRNLLFLFLLITILSWLPLTKTAYLATVIMLACPIPGLVVMLSLVNQRSTKFPTEILCLSTISSVLTLPLMIMYTTLI